MGIGEREDRRCVLPNIFTQNHPDLRLVLDEAHKYLINSDTARLTQSISSIIRLQRHLATRVIIATQVGLTVPLWRVCYAYPMSRSLR